MKHRSWGRCRLRSRGAFWASSLRVRLRRLRSLRALPRPLPGCSRAGDAGQRRLWRLLRARAHREEHPEKCAACDHGQLLLARPGRQHRPADCVVARCLIRGLLVTGFPNRCHFVTSSAAGAVGKEKGRSRANQECTDLARLSSIISDASVTGEHGVFGQIHAENPTHRKNAISTAPTVRLKCLCDEDPFPLSRTFGAVTDGTAARWSCADVLDCGATGDRESRNLDLAE